MKTSARYPLVMAYATSIVAADGERSRDWYHRLRADEQAARDNYPAIAAMATEFAQMLADYAAQEAAFGRDGYPYSRAINEFLGLPVNVNGEHTGQYVARCVANHYKLGVAERACAAAIAEGKTLRVVAAKSKKTGKPVRFHTFAGPGQIMIEGADVKINNGKMKGRLASNWSIETCLENVAKALTSGRYYGEPA